MINERFDRNIRFFGKEGQQRLAASHVAVVGIGGLGTHVVQQLALLGVGHLTLIDKEGLDKTNMNRYVGVRHDDPIGTPKVELGARLVREINPNISIRPLPASFVSDEGFAAIREADYVFGCLDSEGLRLILNEVCAAYAKPYIDLASEIHPGNPPTYGGRVCVAWDGDGCIVCLGELDLAEAGLDLEAPESRRNREAIYGVPQDFLGEAGPSVVSINGVVASLGVTEFMLGVTGVRPPRKVCRYYGNMGRPTQQDPISPEDCYYCKAIRGKGEAANVGRYIQEGRNL